MLGRVEPPLELPPLLELLLLVTATMPPLLELLLLVTTTVPPLLELLLLVTPPLLELLLDATTLLEPPELLLELPSVVVVTAAVCSPNDPRPPWVRSTP